jgi:hypothetical protein
VSKLYRTSCLFQGFGELRVDGKRTGTPNTHGLRGVERTTVLAAIEDFENQILKKN